ncbi:MAG: T9SS type A sorting domain-containing protein, partial [Bacteroidales bacterium]|nr:T9SS type A sorting domain-containing protein [Bacteroidales bacterium]
DQPGYCTKVDSVRVTVKPLFATTISNDTTVCEGSSVMLSVSGGDARTWSTGDTSSAITVAPITTTTYTVASQRPGYCLMIDSVKVNIINLVPTIATNDTFTCDAGSITLSVSGGASQLWNTGDTTNSIIVAPTTTTTYYVVSDSVGYCTKTDTITVSVLQTVATMISNDMNICQGNTATLSISGGESRLWSTGESSQIIVVSPTTTTTYYVTTDSVGKCSKTDSVTVVVHPSPLVVITGDTAINIGETATLTASGAQSYVWSTGATTRYIYVSPYITTTYSVVGTDEFGCQNTAEATVVVNANSITDASEIDFKVYPIPTQTKLTVEADDLSSITIYNLLGKKIEKIETEGVSSIDIDVRGYAQGVYVIVVENSKGLTGRRTFIVR